MTCKIGFFYTQCEALLFVRCIEDGFRVNLVRTEREWLDWPARGLGLAYGGQHRERGVDCRNTTPIEAPTVASRAFAG